MSADDEEPLLVTYRAFAQQVSDWSLTLEYYELRDKLNDMVAETYPGGKVRLKAGVKEYEYDSVLKSHRSIKNMIMNGQFVESNINWHPNNGRIKRMMRLLTGHGITLDPTSIDGKVFVFQATTHEGVSLTPVKFTALLRGITHNLEEQALTQQRVKRTPLDSIDAILKWVLSLDSIRRAKLGGFERHMTAARKEYIKAVGKPTAQEAKAASESMNH
jgi:hypothetical protein